MALTSTDQYWGEKLKIAQQETEQAQAENAQLKLMISGKGGSPGQPYDNPEDGKGPFVPPPKSAGLRINPNTIMLPKEPAPAESDDDYGEGDVSGHPDWKLSRANNIRGFQDSGYQLNIPLHDWKQIPPGIKNDPDFIRLHLRRMQAHGKHFDSDGVPIQDPTRGMDPSGNPITIPHLQQTPEEHEQNKQLHMDKYHPKNDLQITGLNLGGGRHLTNDDINFLRSIFPTVSEKEKHRLIQMYSDKPFRGLV